MSESYPYQRSAAAPGGGNAESQRLSARMKQDLVQLAADQRQLKHERTALDRLKAELDARQQELDAALQSLQDQRQLFEKHKHTAGQDLDARGRALDARLHELDVSRQNHDERRRDLDGRRQGLDIRQQELDTRQRDLETRQRVLDARQQESDTRYDQITQQQGALTRRAAELQTAEQELQVRAGQLDAHQKELEEREKQWWAEADRLADRQHDRTAQQREVDVRQHDLDGRRQDLDTRQEDLEARQRDVDARRQDLDARQRGLDARQKDVDALHAQIRQQQEALNRRAAELQAAERGLDQRKVSLGPREADLHTGAAALAERERLLQSRVQDLAGQRETLQGQEAKLREQHAALGRQQEELAELQKRLTDRQRDLDEREAELGRRQQSFELAAAASREKASAGEDARLAAADDQIAALTDRLRTMQAEVEELRAQRQQAVARCDGLARQCSALQSRVDELTAAQKNVPAVAAAPQPVAPTAAAHPATPAAIAAAGASSAAAEPAASTAIAHAPAPADDLAALAAHAVRIRRRGARAGRPSPDRSDRPSVTVAAAVALLAGLLAGLGVWRGQAPRYWLQARIAFAPNSPLASGPELAKAQRELGGRLLDARLPGVLWPADRQPVLADAKTAQLTVQVLTVSPAASPRALRDILAQYRSELEGTIQDAARAQQDRQLTEQIAGAEIQLKQLAADRQALESEAARFQSQVKAYQDASAAAEKARKDLEEAGRKAADISARLRVLQRTPPGTRGEVPPDRIAAAAAADVQLAEVRSQVIARAAVLQELLRGLLTSALARCDRMDGLVDGFAKFVADQQKQISDQTLRGETARIGERASRLKGVVQRCRKQIDGLSDALSKSQDFAQAAALVDVQATSEKALEVLTSEAAAAIQQVDDLLEKIPAGGADVTRRTVLQQRLRSQFAEVQKAQHEMSETLNSLRPAVNFRLDAALTAVSGLARRYQDRHKALTEQMQQQDAQARRQEYDRQVQQAQAQREELAVESDRFLARLTEATGEMLDAEAGRSRSVQIRWQIDELDRRIAAARTDLEAARQKQANLQSTASQAAIAALADPQVVRPSVNRAVRIATAVTTGLVVSMLAFGAYVLALRYLPRRQIPVPAAPNSGRPSTVNRR